MRRLMLGAASAAIVLAAGCSMLGKQAFQEPVVRLQDVRINGVGLTGGNLDVKLSVYNPNGYRLDATRMTYSVIVGDDVRFAAGTVDSRFTVNQNDSSVVSIPVNFSYSGIGAAGRQLLNTGGVSYRVTGDVTVGTVIGNFTVPYSSTGRFNALSGASRQ
ncbi:MAG: LEA type 2 family protein [Gemmatimonadaceae bacterium]|nr:LEA type 2 family protein [Gemmatimonadaceae bacterium]